MSGARAEDVMFVGWTQAVLESLTVGLLLFAVSMQLQQRQPSTPSPETASRLLGPRTPSPS